MASIFNVIPKRVLEVCHFFFSGVLLGYRAMHLLFFLRVHIYRAFLNVLNIYNQKTKRPTLMELFTATGKLKKFFDN
jgi:hypothetical protein